MEKKFFRNVSIIMTVFLILEIIDLYLVNIPFFPGSDSGTFGCIAFVISGLFCYFTSE